MIIRNIDVTIDTVKQTKLHHELSGIPITIKITIKEIEFEIIRDRGKFEVFPGAFIYRKQFPKILSYGITVHKSQGMHICIVDIGNNIFPCG